MNKLSKENKKKQQDLYSKMVGPIEEPKVTVEITAKDLPSIKNWDVGETYTLNLEAKMISKYEGGWDGKQPLKGTFEVIKVKEINDGENDEG